jgi:hypothetical protein
MIIVIVCMYVCMYGFVLRLCKGPPEGYSDVLRLGIIYTVA